MFDVTSRKICGQHRGRVIFSFSLSLSLSLSRSLYDTRNVSRSLLAIIHMGRQRERDNGKEREREGGAFPPAAQDLIVVDVTTNIASLSPLSLVRQR